MTHLEQCLRQAQVWHRFIEKPETIHTKDAAEQAGIPLEKITKSLVLLDAQDQPLLAIIPGNCRLSIKKVELLTGKALHLAPAAEAERYSGYLPGATPMVCHKVAMPVIIEQRLVHNGNVYGGGGERTRLLEMNSADVIRMTRATEADITE